MTHEVSSLQLNETKPILIAPLIMCNVTTCAEMHFSVNGREVSICD